MRFDVWIYITWAKRAYCPCVEASVVCYWVDNGHLSELSFRDKKCIHMKGKICEILKKRLT